MKKQLSILLFVLLIGFIGCSEDDNPAAPTNQLPDPPSNLIAEAVSDSEIQLAWSDTNSSANGFRLQRTTSDTGNWMEVATVEADAREYTDETLEEGLRYLYRIKAINESGESEPSNIAEAITLAKAPSGLTAEQDSTLFTTIKLTWIDKSEKETGYQIERKQDEDGIYETISDLASDETVHHDLDLEPNQTYYYRVRAMIDSVGSEWSDEVGINVEVPSLSPPENLTATSSSANQVQLTWTESGLDATGYRIQRTVLNSGSWQNAADSLEADVVEFSDSGLLEATSYNYMIKAFNTYTESEWSAPASVTTLANAPTGLSAVQHDSLFTTVILTWTDASEHETGCQIQRRNITAEGTYEIIADLEADVEEYSDEDLDGNVRYSYQVRAMIDTVGSLWSAEAFVSTNILTPTPPSELTAQATGPYSINLRWNDNSVDNDGFIIERKLADESDWAIVYTLALPDLFSYNDEGLQDRTTYVYRVSAYNVYGNSDYSNEAEATTERGPPPVPANLRLMEANFEVVTLAWDDDSEDEDGFILDRSENNSTPWISFYDIGPNVTVFSDSSVAANTRYFYRIRSYNSAGGSAWSSPSLEVTTPLGPPRTPVLEEATALSSSSVLISWSIQGENHIGFILERKITEGNFSQIGPEIAPEVREYTDSELEENTTYFYRISSFNDVARSDYSNVLSVQTPFNAIFYEGFEEYDEDEIPPDPPWTIAVGLGSTCLVSTEDAKEGQQSLEFIDPYTNEEESAKFAHAFLEYTPLDVGIITFWLKIAPDGAFGLGGVERVNGVLTFQIQFNANGSIQYTRGNSWITAANYSYPTDRWFKVEITYDVDQDPDSDPYSFTIDDDLSINSVVVYTDLPDINALFFIAFSNMDVDYVYLDEISIADNSNEERRSRPKHPMNIDPLLRDKFNILNGYLGE